MSQALKTQKEILQKLQITALNEMQLEAQAAIHGNKEVMLLSPTGSGKTLAFLLPIIAELNSENNEVQVLILVPSRELAIQIEQVAREMGTGYKVNAVYGGRMMSKDKIELKHNPAILVGTPGRVADHIRRNTFDPNNITTLVLDEFDKSLEIGFEDDMEEIISSLKHVKKKVLTSATNETEVPKFVKLSDPKVIDYSKTGVKKLQIKRIISPEKDKLDTLVKAICHLGNQPGIIFCNYKESINRVSDYLDEHDINHGCFYGGMDQKDRERALIKFRNGTHQIIIATDLAARGLDVPEIKFIIHYHLPLRSQEFVHRNGRTARMHMDGTAYILQWAEEILPEFIDEAEIEELTDAETPKPSKWKTVFISGGRKDKISKGDIAGLFLKQGGLEKDELGAIELKQDCAFAAIRSSKVKDAINQTDNTRLKKKKVRIRLI
ncbi:MAG: DEAD/DEAH box helicase [Saprospiraceae bacterium]|nr:DEAD/DEAH box helicase [Saprospiraceae bacterium]